MPEYKVPVWTVSDVNNAIRDLLENTFLPVCVAGEVSGITLHSSGHVYLTLKDSKAQIKAVFFRGVQECRALGIQNGTMVEAYGRISYYPKRGECQLNLTGMRPLGVGQLQIKFEMLKRRLAEEGLFDSSRKKQLPAIPSCIGIVTSPSGAAIKDFFKVALQRFPALNVKVFPSPVQGAGAEKTLASGVRFFNSEGGVDVILVTRGGGSMEDLWPFNEEVLARAIAESSIPVVSAVGHEIDTTISDMVADLRVPTPTAAAEAILPDMEALKKHFTDSFAKMRNMVDLGFERASAHLNRLASSRAISNPVSLLDARQQILDDMSASLDNALINGVREKQTRLASLGEKLRSLDPMAVLRRGYSVIYDDAGHALRDPSSVREGVPLRAVLAKGRMTVARIPDAENS